MTFRIAILTVVVVPMAMAQTPRAVRLPGNPIVTPALGGNIGANINGPSLIRVPEWIPRPLGRYYLYFAAHNGTHIRLAYADRIAGPWKIHAGGVLGLSDTICRGHIASPDVHVDQARREIRMYFHGPIAGQKGQKTLLATSGDGLRFRASKEILGGSYFRVFRHGGYHYAMARLGKLYRSRDGVGNFEEGPNAFGPDSTVRHVAVLVEGNHLQVFFSRIGDREESILFARIELAPDWRDWKASEPVLILKPETSWEGVDQPVKASEGGAIHGPARQLRDPAVYREDGKTYLLYSVAGESGIALAELVATRRVRPSDLPPQLLALDEAAFARLLDGIERRTAQRVREGELDHLVYYLLQSQRFTKEPRIEPALSAREFVESGKIPAAVTRRIGDFQRAGAGDERFAYFRRIAPADLAAEYARAMRFLYEKEFVAQPLAPVERAAALAKLYQQRGHSTDTDARANVAVAEALGVIRALEPGQRISRVLIVGPGVDFAPRTGFRDDAAPESYQPAAVRDALLRLGLAEAAQLRVDCVDVNERVVAHLKAERLNIVTERFDPSPGYDLVVITNVLTYFDQTELLLALANTHSVLGTGGWLIHNELRAELEPLARALGLTPVQGRTVRLGSDLLDAFVIHKKQ